MAMAVNWRPSQTGQPGHLAKISFSHFLRDLFSYSCLLFYCSPKGRRRPERKT